MKYCLDCEWSVPNDPAPVEADPGDRTPAESDPEGADPESVDPEDVDPSGLAVAHATETGHSIASDSPPFPRPLLDRNHPDLSHVLPVTPRRDRCGMNG